MTANPNTPDPREALREDVRFLIAYTIPHPIREFVITRLVDRGWLTDEHDKKCELTAAGKALVDAALAQPAPVRGITVQSLIESARCLGVAQQKGDKAAAAHWNAQVDDYAARLTAPPAGRVPERFVLMPKLPTIEMLKCLRRGGAYPDDWELGKQMQREHGFDVVPPETNTEIAAGQYTRLLSLAARPDAAQEDQT